jgi:hypothetical protein
MSHDPQLALLHYHEQHAKKSTLETTCEAQRAAHMQQIVWMRELHITARAPNACSSSHCTQK